MKMEAVNEAPEMAMLSVAPNLLNETGFQLNGAKTVSVIVKEEQRNGMEQDNCPQVVDEAPAHLTFRRLAVTEFGTESEPDHLRFYYRGHGKHLSQRSVA